MPSRSYLTARAFTISTTLTGADKFRDGMRTRHVVLMGVSGCGKTTVGQLLAGRLNAPFLDADSLHPAQNLEKMKAGIPLDDADRKPWLDAVAQRLSGAAAATPLVLACSALKRSYRNIFRAADPTVCFVLLHGSEELLRARLSQRTGHFMPETLLRSQLETLEPLQRDECGMMLDITERPAELARKAAAWMRDTPATSP